MDEANNLGRLLQRLIDGTASDGDRQDLKEAIAAGNLCLVTGARAVAVGGNVTDTVIISGDHNFVFKGDDAAALCQSFLALYPSRLRQLPADLPDFTGREPEVEKLLQLFLEGSSQAAISALGGMGGVGKTALAVHVGHKIAVHYPEAQIVVDLAGTTETPMSPIAAMSRVINAFEPQARLPESQDEVAALYHSLLTGRRVLLLLDNAASSTQVRSLLPPPSAAAIVTSRRTVVLPGLTVLNLDVLSEADAVDLLFTILGKGRASTEEIVVLADRCSRLPLALRVAGSFLVSHPDWTVAEYLEALAQEKELLQRLRHEDLEVEATLGLSAVMLARENSEWAKRWQMLTIFPGSFDRAGAAAVWQVAKVEARDILSELLTRSLILYDRDTGRYRLHDLMRLVAANAFGYGGSQIEPVDTEPQVLTSRRHATYYIQILKVANEFYRKGGATLRQGLDLFDLEWDNIQAGQAWAAATSRKDEEAAHLCSAFPDAGAFLLALRRHPRMRIAWLEAALDAARFIEDPIIENIHIGNVGLAYYDLGEYHRAIEFYEKRLTFAREMNDREGEAATLGNLGNVYADLGKYWGAIECHEKNLIIAQDLGDRRGEGIALVNLGVSYYDIGYYELSIVLFIDALAILREVEDREVEGLIIGNLGNAYASLGEYRQAIEYYERRLTIAREIGDQRGEGAALGNLGVSHATLGNHRQAIEYYMQHLNVARKIGHRQGEGTSLGNLGVAYARLGNYGRAVEFYEQHLAIAQQTGDRPGEGIALGNLGIAYSVQGQHQQAIECYERRLTIAREIGDRPGEGVTLLKLSLALDILGERKKAILRAKECLKIFEQIKFPQVDKVRQKLAAWSQESSPTNNPNTNSKIPRK